jgi:hypothetical protein
MDVLFIVLLFSMLVLVGYAKVQHGVAKTTGSVVFEDED